jgi:uncharacterized protein
MSFATTKAEDKPVMTSIRYSACHCVMFWSENLWKMKQPEAINENFVNIKIDLEERSDIDKIYMKFVQLANGHSGYPLNAFLTPDKLQFFWRNLFSARQTIQYPEISAIVAEHCRCMENKA